MRITGGDNPLDASAVHPEAYPVVEKILEKTGSDILTLIGNQSVLRQLKASDFTDDRFGIPTVKDILSELENRVEIQDRNLKRLFSKRVWKPYPI